jgi:cytosine/adenosine deaminase-related metal-dependent hydrolase
MKKVKNIFTRMIAVVIATALGTIGAGSIIGFDTWKTAALAAIMAVAVVSEDLARAYLKDGNLTDAEINAAFSKIEDEEVDSVTTAELAAKAEEILYDEDGHTIAPGQNTT